MGSSDTKASERLLFNEAELLQTSRGEAVANGLTHGASKLHQSGAADAERLECRSCRQGGVQSSLRDNAIRNAKWQTDNPSFYHTLPSPYFSIIP